MRNNLTLFVFVLACSGPLPIHGQDFAPVGTAVGQFLEIGMGARATSLGEAYTAVSRGAGSVFWNPAGLVDAGKVDLALSLHRWPADLALGGFSIALNLGPVGVVAFSAISLISDDMEVTTLLEPEGTGKFFGLTNVSYGLTFARYLTDKVSVGVTGKIVQEKYWDFGYSSWALDIGTLYRTDFHDLTLGMAILHFGPEVRFSGEYIDFSDPRSVDVDSMKTFETYSLPINFRFGTSINVFDHGVHRIVISTDMVHPNNNLEEYNGGMEYSFNQLVFLRSGYRFNADQGGLTFGGGIRVGLGAAGSLVVDYAYSDLGILTFGHQFTLVLSL